MVDPSPALPAIAAAVAPDTDQLLPTPKLFTVLVVGDIHEGKSQLIDALCDTSSDQIGPEILEVGGIRSNGDGTTKGCPSYRGRVLQGRRIKIFDSPGISDGTAFLEEDPMTLTASNTEPDPDASVAAGTGGLLSLLEKTFHKNQINLVIVVHPCNKTGVQMGARVLRCLIDKGLVAGNEDAWENIVVAFTKADLLERMPKLERKAQRKQLVRVVLPLYFPHLFHPDGTPKPGAAPDKQYCFTTGVPWEEDEDEDEDEDDNDDSGDYDSDDEKEHRPTVKTVDTAELEALISRIIIDRPSFYHQIRELTPKDYQLIFEQGFRQAFTSTASLANFLKGVNAQKKRIIELETNMKEPTGTGNVNEERRRIGKWLQTATSEIAKELRLRERDAFLFRRTTQRGFGRTGKSRMNTTMLQNEFIKKGHIGPRPPPGSGGYPKKAGFPSLCPPKGSRGDIAWALYEKATVEVDGFDGSQRVPFVPEDVASAQLGTPIDGNATSSSPCSRAPASTPASASGSSPAYSSRAGSRTKSAQTRSMRPRPALTPEALERSSRQRSAL